MGLCCRSMRSSCGGSTTLMATGCWSSISIGNWCWIHVQNHCLRRSASRDGGRCGAAKNRDMAAPVRWTLSIPISNGASRRTLQRCCVMTADTDHDFVIRWDAQRDPVELLQREWLVTNGLGGYASASLCGAATRKYHGLFVPNLSAPKGRHVLISRCDELVVVGEQQFLLGAVEFADDKLIGDTHR